MQHFLHRPYTVAFVGTTHRRSSHNELFPVSGLPLQDETRRLIVKMYLIFMKPFFNDMNRFNDSVQWLVDGEPGNACLPW
jgi:hypothetical protein